MNILKPIVGITMGDPAGIGPETCVEALTSPEIYASCKPLLIGCEGTLQRALEQKELDKKGFRLHVITDPSDGFYELGTIDVISTGDYDWSSIRFGEVQRLAGQMAYDAILKSIDLAMDKKIDIVGTAPIHKEAIKLIGVPQAGHTEIFEDLTNSPYALTMFNCHKLRVFFVSRHISLRNACDYATKEKVLESVKQIHTELSKLGLKQPKIAVAALNPHGSDNGLFGTEERDHLIPAVEAAKELGINAIGPVPADSVFYRGKNGMYDGILSLYHDQGHIACKTYDFEKSVTITFGLPFLRSSVDHGTAFDIAGKNIAQSISLVESTLQSAEYWRMQSN